MATLLNKPQLKGSLVRKTWGPALLGVFGGCASENPKTKKKRKKKSVMYLSIYFFFRLVF